MGTTVSRETIRQYLWVLLSLGGPLGSIKFTIVVRPTSKPSVDDWGSWAAVPGVCPGQHHLHTHYGMFSGCASVLCNLPQLRYALSDVGSGGQGAYRWRDGCLLLGCFYSGFCTQKKRQHWNGQMVSPIWNFNGLLINLA